MHRENGPAWKGPSAYAYAGLVAVAWTAVIAMLSSGSISDRRKELHEVAYAQALTAYTKDVLYRRWCAERGGVYVPVTDSIQPNPYLHAPERDITTPSGRKLTLVNSAWMTRQVATMAQEQTGVRAHVTSLQPLRPENVPDAWETQALRALAAGKEECTEMAVLDGQPYMRFDAPVVRGTKTA